jgi:4a-hydroxytetrahydrobiopterin dehydratase
MSEKRTTARAFHDAAGVEDWRVLFSGALAYFRVGSFAEAATFVAAIAEAAEAVGHFPDVDVRPEGVTVRTASGEYGALSQRDVELARRISAEARKLGIEPDPSQVQVVGIAVAQDAGSDVGPFWAAALGYRSLGPKEDVVDRHRRNPYVSFQPLHPPSRGVAGPTSTSACRPIRPKHESRPHSKLADAWRTVPTRPIGGRSRRPRTTVSTSRPGRTSRTTRTTDHS